MWALNAVCALNREPKVPDTGFPAVSVPWRRKCLSPSVTGWRRRKEERMPPGQLCVSRLGQGGGRGTTASRPGSRPPPPLVSSHLGPRSLISSHGCSGIMHRSDLGAWRCAMVFRESQSTLIVIRTGSLRLGFKAHLCRFLTGSKCYPLWTSVFHL